MSRALLDVNVLVAIAWPNHLHHHDARQWFLESAGGGWATCALTELGFMRISCNPTVVGEPVTAGAAEKLLSQLKDVGDHQFWPEMPATGEIEPGLLRAIVGHRQVTDAYLLHVARLHGGRLATLDRGVRELPVSAGLYTEGETAEGGKPVVEAVTRSKPGRDRPAPSPTTPSEG